MPLPVTIKNSHSPQCTCHLATLSAEAADSNPLKNDVDSLILLGTVSLGRGITQPLPLPVQKPAPNFLREAYGHAVSWGRRIADVFVV